MSKVTPTSRTLRAATRDALQAAGLDPDDMRQASIILASFLWNAANMQEDFPRRPLPRKPS